MDGYEPHDHISLAVVPASMNCGTAGGGRGVPGMGYGRVGWEGLYRYPPDPSQDPYFSIFEAKGPTYGQMRAKYDCSMRFPRTGSR